MFFSPENHDPNFNLAIRGDFDEYIDGIYLANILKAFHTKAKADAYVAKRRNVLSVNYCSDTAQADDDLDETTFDENYYCGSHSPRAFLKLMRENLA